MKNNLLRQLIDIQNQADIILKGNISPDELTIFLKYLIELKSYIQKNIENELIQKIIVEIPELEFNDVIKNAKTVNLLGFDLSGLFGKTNKLETAEDLINLTKSKFASIETILRNNI